MVHPMAAEERLCMSKHRVCLTVVVNSRRVQQGREQMKFIFLHLQVGTRPASF